MYCKSSSSEDLEKIKYKCWEAPAMSTRRLLVCDSRSSRIRDGGVMVCHTTTQGEVKVPRVAGEGEEERSGWLTADPENAAAIAAAVALWSTISGHLRWDNLVFGRVWVGHCRVRYIGREYVSNVVSSWRRIGFSTGVTMRLWWTSAETRS